MIKKFWDDYHEQRVHLVGEYVGICWNFDWVSTPEGKIIRKVRKTSPYIDAWSVYEIDENGVGYVDEDRPLRGMSLEFAEQIHKELGEAIAYLKEVTHE